ncbi:hypothetical protein GCM10010094_93840 [Streptomyces flaveus]|uniref:Uncharacterized protein n=1 Tax=Streptomyces flaveus TaxID=66370 RepID=A0A917RQ28_9ACTN|nr:hypothetical protein GCM10010094_93840 [Streptomyces flaveus]
MADEESKDPAELTIVMGANRTDAHAMQLLVTGRKKGCSDLSITCKPSLVSCTPVTQCANYDIVAPGCSPLECNPVKTQFLGRLPFSDGTGISTSDYRVQCRHLGQ